MHRNHFLFTATYGRVQLRAWSLKSKYLSYGPILEKQLKDMRKVSYRVRWEEGESIIPEW